MKKASLTASALIPAFVAAGIATTAHAEYEIDPAKYIMPTAIIAAPCNNNALDDETFICQIAVDKEGRLVDFTGDFKEEHYSPIPHTNETIDTTFDVSGSIITWRTNIGTSSDEVIYNRETEDLSEVVCTSKGCVDTTETLNPKQTTALFIQILQRLNSYTEECRYNLQVDQILHFKNLSFVPTLLTSLKLQ